MPPKETWTFINGLGISYSAEGVVTYREIVDQYIRPDTRPFVHKIKKVIFNNPATIVFWADNTKTVVKCNGEDFDPEKGLAMAISKKALGNQGNYFNEIKKWVEPYEEENDQIVNQMKPITNISFDTSKLKEKAEQILKDFGFKSPSVEFKVDY